MWAGLAPLHTCDHRLAALLLLLLLFVCPAPRVAPVFSLMCPSSLDKHMAPLPACRTPHAAMLAQDKSRPRDFQKAEGLTVVPREAEIRQLPLDKARAFFSADSLASMLGGGASA